MVLPMMYTLLIVPYMLAFTTDSHQKLSQTDMIIQWAIEGLFMVDFQLNFLTAYEDSTGKLVSSNE